MGIIDCEDVASLDPEGLISRIYGGDYYKLLHGLMDSKKIFFFFSHVTSTAEFSLGF